MHSCGVIWVAWSIHYDRNISEWFGIEYGLSYLSPTESPPMMTVNYLSRGAWIWPSE